MNKIIITLALLLSTLGLSAHSTHASSAMLIEQSEGVWLLQIRSALTAFEHEVHRHFGEDSYDTPAAFNELVIQYLSDEIDLRFDDGESLVISEPTVRLGHETSVVYRVLDVPERYSDMSFRFTGFSDIYRSETIFFMVDPEIERSQFRLTESNDHTLDLELIDGALISRPSSITATTDYTIILLSAAAILLIGSVVYLLSRGALEYPLMSVD